MEKFKKNVIDSMFSLLAPVKTDNISDKGRIAITRNFINSKKVWDEISIARELAKGKLITDEFKKLQDKKDKTDDEKMHLSKLDAAINLEFAEIINPILDEEIEFDIMNVSEKDFDIIIAENKILNKFQLNYLHELIVDKK